MLFRLFFRGRYGHVQKIVLVKHQASSVMRQDMFYWSISIINWHLAIVSFNREQSRTTNQMVLILDVNSQLLYAVGR